MQALRFTTEYLLGCIEDILVVTGTVIIFLTFQCGFWCGGELLFFPGPSLVSLCGSTLFASKHRLRCVIIKHQLVDCDIIDNRERLIRTA